MVTYDQEELNGKVKSERTINFHRNYTIFFDPTK